jgi:hypothetical protein
LLDLYYDPRHRRNAVLEVRQRPPATGEQWRSGRRRAPTCAEWYAWALGEVRRIHPRAIVLAQFWSAWGPGGVRAIGRELDDVGRLARNVLVIQDAPPHPEPAVDCLLAPGATRGSCTFRVTRKEARTYAGVRSTVAAAGGNYVRTMQWLCYAGKCPTVVGNVVTYRDRHHLTNTYARFLARPIAHRIWRILS